MKIIPAIDLIDGKPVRLYQGDYKQKTQVADDAMSQALEFEDQGAGMLHMVDLDGAKAGKPMNRDLIVSIANALEIPVEVGGGIRSFEQVQDYLENGVSRVILGTVAIEDPKLLKKALEMYGNKIVLGLDVMDETIRTRGWLQDSRLNLFDFLKQAKDLGASEIIVTDIATDGTQQGTNLELMEKILHESGMNLVASGGIGSLEDIEKLNRINPKGIIVGKALYDKKFTLGEAIDLVS